ncbi:hypothetical protein SLE2022_255690 [Rubroshorea leprosula]
METERQALLQFKQGLIDRGDRLASWVPDDRDCCRWAGIVCNNLTGHVLELHLRSPELPAKQLSYAEFEDYMASKLSGKINPSLLGLKHLTYLDLSNNDFQGISIPKFLGSFGGLRHINLSNALFGGEVPPQLGNLSNLQYLDLHHDHWRIGRRLYVESLEWLSDLSLLEHLDLKSVSLKKASNGLQYVNNLPSLVELCLSICQFNQIHPLSHANLSSLAILDLSMNDIENSTIINWVFGLKNLVFLDLSYNGVQGLIPEGLQNMSSLKHLDLCSNDFTSSVPDWLYSFSPLEFLDLRGNHLQGQISSAIGNLTFALSLGLSGNDFNGGIPRSIGKLCNLRSIALSDVGLNQNISIVLEIFSRCVSNTLESLDLSWCGLFGQLTNQLARFKKLTKLFLGGNSIFGPIPPFIGKLSSLQALDLSDNILKGNLPESLGQLVNLARLDISKNLLGGVVSEIHFYNLSNLKIFVGNGNPLILKVNSNWIPPFQISILGLQSWVLGPGFPHWFCSQKYLIFLDFSNTGVLGSIPSCFWNFTSQFQHLNLSHNEIHGELPKQLLFPSFALVDFGSNYFSGPLPHIPFVVTLLDLSNNQISGSLSQPLCYEMNETMVDLEFLNLGENSLSGDIPDCWMKWQYLQVIILASNRLTGRIPNSMGTLYHLRSLHLQKNSLSGEITPSLRNCRRICTLDFEDNELDGNIPAWLGHNLPNVRILILGSNKLRGPIPNEICALTFLQVLDLSHNNISGSLPRCISNFSSMAFLKDGDLNTYIQYNSAATYWMSMPFVARSFYFLPRYQGANIVENALVVMKGQLLEYSTILNLVRSIDLSGNNLSGEIPKEMSSLQGLQSLNLSHNYLTGSIPENIGDMKSLETLDLSVNSLSSSIPPSMSSLTFLNHLNLSNNHLIGSIPSSTQLQSFDASSYAGNQLCGLPLPNNCSTNDVAPNSGNGYEEKGRADILDWFISILLGLIVGFWGVLIPLMINRGWRNKYYNFLDNIWSEVSLIVSRCF